MSNIAGQNKSRQKVENSLAVMAEALLRGFQCRKRGDSEWRLFSDPIIVLVIERYFMELMVEVLVILDVVAVCQVYGQEM